jgi:hypothetical protein
VNCRRCDYRADDLEEHARETGHWLCVVCRRRSLTEFEPQSCPDCVGNIRADLADLVTAYTELQPTSLYALTLLGDGTMQRHARRDEVDSGIRDEWPNDPLPVLPALASWEDYIRDHYRDPKGAANPTLTEVVDYLTRNLDTGHMAAQTFPAFDELAASIRRHLSQLHHALGWADDPRSANADCTRCGGTLHRAYRPPARTDEERQRLALRAVATMLAPVHNQRAAERTYGLLHLTRLPAPFEIRDAAEPAMLGLDDEGLDDIAVCRGCGHEYTSAEYRVALRLKALANATGWITVPAAAGLLERPEQTVWTWVRRMVMPSACRLTDGRIVVDAETVKAKATKSQVNTQQCA